MSGNLRRFGVIASALVTALVFLCSERDASAFCGFYVSGADGKLFNDATQVVLMREGTRTVLAMQNDYKGPVQDFAMVVPVPVVLQKENVKTLSRALFDKVDTLSAPRLVEYWEQDPCPKDGASFGAGFGGAKGAGLAGIGGGTGGAGTGAEAVRIEAQFEVGEYEIVILSAQDSSGLDAWLRVNKYKIPDNAEPALKPYVASGSKFFVAKVNAAKVKFENGVAHLSPLRFHYDTDTFQLPVKLGMLNSSGTQDLIVNVIAPNGQRYAVANYPEAVIPTNLDVAESARGSFAPFYASLFDKTLEANPGAVVTEYAWGAQSCDPCPGEVQGLTTLDLAMLGADVLPSAKMGPPGSGLIIGGPKSDAQLQGVEMISGAKIQDADRVLAGLRPRFRQCYQTGLNRDPSMEGSIALKVVAAATGEVSSCEVASSPGLSPAVASCIAGVVRRAHFASGGTFTVKAKFVPQDKPKTPPAPVASGPPPKDVLLGIGDNFVLTRLHARYTSGALANDLVFKTAGPLMGGREKLLPNGQRERGAFTSEDKPANSPPVAYRGGYRNEFQARYAIRHAWQGAITCEKPVRDRWGGPWPDAGVGSPPAPAAATKLAYASREKPLASFLPSGLPDFRAEVRQVTTPVGTATPDPTPATTADVDASSATDGGTGQASKGRCGCDVVGSNHRSAAWLVLAVALAAALTASRRARRR